jgi:hypothetical protein
MKIYLAIKSRNNCIHVQGAAISIQTWTGPKGSRRLRLPEFLGNRHMKVARLSALLIGRLYPPEDTPFIG